MQKKSPKKNKKSCLKSLTITEKFVILLYEVTGDLSKPQAKV